MTRNLAARFLSIFGLPLFWSFCASALAQESRKTFDCIAQDDTGGIWGISSSRREIASYRDGRWEAQTLPDVPSGARPALAQRVESGEVACVWSDPKTKQSALTLHRDTRSGSLNRAVRRRIGLQLVVHSPRLDAQKHISRLIGGLGSDDFAERNAAEQALVRYGASALAPLRSAREKADDNLAWWIDATLQEIQRNQEKLKQ